MKENSKDAPVTDELKKDAQENVENTINPDIYGYRNGQMISISPNNIFYLMPLLKKIIEQESAAMNILTPSEKEGEMPTRTRHSTLTDIGVETLGAMQLLTDLHVENIKNGVAISREVLEQEALQAQAQATAIPVDEVPEETTAEA